MPVTLRSPKTVSPVEPGAGPWLVGCSPPEQPPGCPAELHRPLSEQVSILPSPGPGTCEVGQGLLGAGLCGRRGLSGLWLGLPPICSPTASSSSVCTKQQSTLPPSRRAGWTMGCLSCFRSSGQLGQLPQRWAGGRGVRSPQELRWGRARPSCWSLSPRLLGKGNQMLPVRPPSFPAASPPTASHSASPFASWICSY